MIRPGFFVAMRQNGPGRRNFGLVNRPRVDKIALPPPGMAGEHKIRL
ncbi:hypothetical protein DPM33_10070 [Mesorhizobium hawassense]|uniref:Uncharacterized protein n=1 Tax=Mesorhizobium hawassense TaxID=1209954 RepID=A0A330HVC0_9HYPH|nr:hypothetical protein DPM33_10070 [Mesorhizobium hawassense]